MPSEHIGEVGTAGAEREWIVAQATIAIRRIIEICGPPPIEMELEIQWQEHDLGEYPVIVLSWEDGMRAAPWKYINRCADVLDELENGAPPFKGPIDANHDEDPYEEDLGIEEFQEHSGPFLVEPPRHDD